MKTCVDCGREQPITSFPIASKHSNGIVYRTRRCRSCFNADQKRRREQRKAEEQARLEAEGEKPKVKAARCTPVGCVFYDTCHAQWRSQGFVPYCFEESKYHAWFVAEYAVDLEQM